MSETARLIIAVDSSQARNANKDLGALERGASTLTSGLGKLVGPLVSVAGAMMALNKASDVQRQFDVLNSGLITATGSTEKAAVAFKALQSFAQKTPYDLNQAVEGFTKLVNLGLTPSERALTSYGNTASAMGKNLNDMIEAVADATTSEFERLKEFGIKSRVAGDSIAFTFQGVTKSVGNNAAEIEKYLADLGENQFAGAMKLRMDTLDGAIANLGDTWDTTFRLINESGLGEVMRDSVNEAITALDELNAQLASGELEATLSAIAGKFDGFGKDIGLAFDEISKLFESDSGYWSSLLEHNVANMTATFRDLPENVRAFMKLMTVEVLSGFDTVKAYARAFNDGINAIFSNDTFEGVGVRLDAELSAVSKTRQDGIQYILNEREASLASFDAQIKGATERRRAFDEAAAADAADTTDRLAQFKAITDGSKAQSDEDKKAAKAAETLVNQRKKALDSLILQSAISTKSSNDMADAYLSGADSVRELAIQQKIEEELLKTGAVARDKVTAAVNREADAKDRLDITQSIASMRTETTQTLAQATATLQGKDALEAFNIQKSMTVALAGRNIEVGSKEYQLLLDQTKAQLDANKALEQANSIEGIVDRLNPQVKLLRDYTKEQKALNAAIASGTGDTALYQDTLAKLALEYEQNKNAATAWGQFTEGAVDRVDSAFADAWKNIDDGFSGFATSLKDGFKQLLAELAHMAITKPIIMQIGASLGVGGLSAQSSGLFGGSSGGGTDIFSLAKGANQLYSVANSGFGQAISSGWASGDGLFGGLQNAFSGGYGYVGSALGFGSGAAGAAASSGLAQGAAAYGSQFGTGIGAVSFPGAASGAAGGAASGAASAGLSGLGAAGYGIGGALYGYSQAGLKGAATGAAGAVGGAYAGAAIGSVVPIIGTAIGAAIGAVLGGVVGGSLFGGDWQTKDQGLSLGVENGDFAGQQFEYQKKKGGLFGKNKKRTRYSALDPETQAALDATYDATEGSVLDLFDRLNVELNDGVLDGLNIGAQKISTKDKTAEEIQAEIAKWFGGVADSMVSAVDAATAAGLGGYNFETLTTFVNNLYSVNDSFEMLGLKLYDVSVSTGFMAEQLISMAGGLEALKAGESSFFENFYTDTEKADYALSTVNKQFEAMGVKLPGTRDAYRDMVEALDRTTESGRQMYVTLTGMSGSAAQAFDILESRTNALNESMMGAATNAQGAVQRAISAQQKRATEAYNATNTSLNDMVSTVTENVSGLNSVSTSLSAALKALRGDSDDAVKMLRAQAQATLQSALATARSGKSLSGFTGLEDALDTVSNNNTDLYGSMEDFARDQGRTANVVAELNAINGKQLTSAEASLAGLKTQIDLAKAAYDAQMAQFDSQLAFAQAQMDALNGVDNSVMGVTAAVNAMNAAVVAALAGMGGKGATNSAATNGTFIDSVYKDVLGRDADDAGKQYWLGQVASGNVPLDQLAQAVANAAKLNSNEKVKAGYATGGLVSGPGTGTSDSIFARLSNGEYVMQASAVSMFGTGLLDQMNAGLVPAFATGGGIGESGPQLEVTGPSRIFNANQTASMLNGGGGNGELIAEVRQLRTENRQAQFQIVKLTQKIEQIMTQWNSEGTPKERDYAL